MKIDQSVKQLPGITAVGEGALRQGNGPAEARASVPERDNVELSALSAQLRSLAQSVSDAEVTDAAKVAEIRAAIAEGRLRINPQAIADELIETARELLVRSRR